MNKNIIKKYNIIYYKKIYLYHCIVFDYCTIDEKYNSYYKLRLKRLDIKTICNCCFLNLLIIILFYNIIVIIHTL